MNDIFTVFFILIIFSFLANPSGFGMLKEKLKSAIDGLKAWMNRL